MSTDTLLGHTIGGRWVIKRPLAEEQLGRVYAAEQLPKGDPVAVKVLHPHLCEDPEILARFGREMLATATISHPNSVQMLDFGEHRGLFHFLVLEHLEGRTVAERLAAGEKFSAERVAHVAAQIASALTAAHKENIIHRNLCPANVLLLDGTKDYVKVRDFGLSRLQVQSAGDGFQTAVGARVGNTAYMAPEYIMVGLVDPRGDLYALGCVMFEMLTGRPPFVGKGGEMLDAHCTQAPPAPSSLVRGVPPWMDALVLRLLAKTPNDRPKDAGEVVSILENAVKRPLGPPPRPVSKTRTGEAPEPAEATEAASPAPPRSKLGLVVGLAAGALGLLIVTLLVVVVAIYLAP